MDKWNSPLHQCLFLERRQFPAALFTSTQLQSELGHTSVLLRMHCPMVNAKKKREDSPPFARSVLRADFSRILSVERWKDLCAALWRSLSQKIKGENSTQTQDIPPGYLPLPSKKKASELESALTVVWTGTECYNIMIEYWGREPRRNIPFPSRVECLLWSSNCSPENPLCSWIIWAAEVETEFFLWRPKLLKSEEEEEEEGGETNKKVWKWYKLNRRANIYICVCVCVCDRRKVIKVFRQETAPFLFPSVQIYTTTTTTCIHRSERICTYLGYALAVQQHNRNMKCSQWKSSSPIAKIASLNPSRHRELTPLMVQLLLPLDLD